MTAHPGGHGVAMLLKNICFLHIQQIKEALGIAGVYTEISSSQSRGQGVQIDLLIDRRDHVISICEIKFSKDPYTLTKAYRTELEKKLSAFRMETKVSKTVFLTPITTFSLEQNQHSLGFIQNVVTMEDLFGLK